MVLKHTLMALNLVVIALPGWAETASDCGIGTYRFLDGSYIDIGPSDAESLRWRRMDGKTGALNRDEAGNWRSTLGWTNRPDGIRVSFDCAIGELMFDGMTGERVAFDIADTWFEVEGATLAGRLVMPKGDQPVPIVIFVHGAEPTSARDFYALQRMLPAVGIGTFVYDKRGTGASTGEYTHDYLTLAVDAVAALHEAKRLAGGRVARIGYQAGSQGGWVAPLAATIDAVDFIIVGFGLAVSPLQAERELIALDMKRGGYGPDIVSKAMEVADAVDAVVVSNFQEGYDQLAALRGKYGVEPWFGDIRGSITAMILDTPPDQLRLRGPKLAPSIPFHYDPMPVLRHLDTPQLWILAEDDVVAPAPETKHCLVALAKSGKPITTAIFPNADHGIYEYETRADGTRVSTRQPNGYFAMMRDFIRKGSIGTGYGAEIVSERNSAEHFGRDGSVAVSKH